MRRPRLSGARSTCEAAVAAGSIVLDELDLGLLEEAVQLFDVGLVEVELGHRLGYLREGEHANLLALGEQTLDLIQLLQLDY